VRIAAEGILFASSFSGLLAMGAGLSMIFDPEEPA
jgi:hypothetical protein